MPAAEKSVESAATLMHIHILSDLHLEFRGNILPPLAPDTELIVLASDLAPVPAGQIGEAARRWAGAERILYVPGNHEFYGSEIDLARRRLAHQCRRHEVTLLDPGAVTIDDIRFNRRIVRTPVTASSSSETHRHRSQPSDPIPALQIPRLHPPRMVSRWT